MKQQFHINLDLHYWIYHSN